MSIELPNNKISRTLPEQVGFNSKKIAEIIKAINDFELVDKVIDLDSASGVLTDTQFGIAELSPSFISYSGKVFIKAYEDGTNIDFLEVGALVGGTTTLTLSVERFRVVVSTKAYQYAVVQLFESYTKSQIDSLLSAGLALKANLDGANFTGAITAPSIIENMSGYSFNAAPGSKGTFTYIYAGVVKNGNKLTFVNAFIFVKNADATGSMKTGEFVCPAEIMSKIYPAFDTYFIDVRKIQAYKVSYAGVDLISQAVKYSNTKFEFDIADVSSLTAGDSYYIRQELTVLLSDNLAQ